jgi:tRNA(Ile)-lysidine synthase
VVDQSALWHCGTYSLYRYKGQLVAVIEDKFKPQSVSGACLTAAEAGFIELPNNGKLVLSSEGDMSGMIASLHVRYRQGGERLSLPGRPSKSLKKLFNEEGVSPWLRDRLPLVFFRGELIWVAGFGASESAVAKTATSSDCGLACVTFSWESPALELGL